MQGFLAMLGGFRTGLLGLLVLLVMYLSTTMVPAGQPLRAGSSDAIPGTSGQASTPSSMPSSSRSLERGA